MSSILFSFKKLSYTHVFKIITYIFSVGITIVEWARQYWHLLLEIIFCSWTTNLYQFLHNLLFWKLATRHQLFENIFQLLHVLNLVKSLFNYIRRIMVLLHRFRMKLAQYLTSLSLMYFRILIEWLHLLQNLVCDLMQRRHLVRCYCDLNII